jgi:hypothetical protein
MHASAVPFVDKTFTRTLADAFPPADHSDTLSLIGDAALRLYDKTVAMPRQESRDNKIAQIQNVRSHSHTPHGLVPKTYEASMKTANETITRTNAEQTTAWLKDVPAIKQRFSAALKADHGHKHSHLKLIAKESGASPRTVEKWTQAQYLPGLEHFLRLIPKSPAIQKMLAELMTLDADTDPRHAVLLNAIQRQTR